MDNRLIEENTRALSNLTNELQKWRGIIESAMVNVQKYQQIKGVTDLVGSFFSRGQQQGGR